MPLGPLFAALIVIPITQGWAGLRELGSRMIRWRVRWYWYVVALGLPLAVHMAAVGLNVAARAERPVAGPFSSLTTFLMVFAVRLVNPAGRTAGRASGLERGLALPGLQADRLAASRPPDPRHRSSAGWHLPLFFLDEGRPAAVPSWSAVS